MKNKILRRVILIMTVAVFVTVALTFFLFNIYTINSIKDFLNQETKFVADKLKDVKSIEEVKFVIEAPVYLSFLAELPAPLAKKIKEVSAMKKVWKEWKAYMAKYSLNIKFW